MEKTGLMETSMRVALTMKELRTPIAAPTAPDTSLLHSDPMANYEI